MNKKYEIHKLYCLNDIQCFIKFKEYNYVYDKLKLIKAQNIYSNVIGIYPSTEAYPIIIKPIINLFGMSRGIKVIRNEDEYENYLMTVPNPSSFWMPFYDTNKREHYTIDVVMKNGKIFFSNTFQCISSKETGIFQKHIYLKDYLLNYETISFLEKYLNDYTGCLNIEIIDSFIIEIHLRFNGDNYIYRENPYIFDNINYLLNNKNFHKYNINYYNIQKFLIIEKEDYVYLPFFIENINNYQYEKDEIERKIQNIIKKNTNKTHVYYDNIDAIHQQEKKRYCVVTIDKNREKI